MGKTYTTTLSTTKTDEHYHARKERFVPLLINQTNLKSVSVCVCVHAAAIPDINLSIIRRRLRRYNREAKGAMSELVPQGA